jgi:hypothetical protein
MAGSKAKALSKPKARARMSNGHALPRTVDQRTLWARRFRDLLALHLGDMADTASEGEKAIIRRACTLMVELERLEERFAIAGEATLNELEVYQRCSNTAARLLKTVGLQRRMKTVQSFGNLLREDAERQQIIDAEASERKRVEFEARQREQRERGTAPS